MNKLTRQISKESPVLLSLLGIGGFVTAVIMAVKATPAAEETIEHNESPFEELTIVEKIRILAPIYAPTVGMLLISAACVVGSTTVSRKRYTAVTTLYAISERTLNMWQDRVLDEVGERKYSKIRSDVAKPPASSTPPTIVMTGDKVLCFDTFSGRYFTVDSVERIRTVVNDLNERLYGDMWVSINDFYYEISLPPVTYGDNIGWAVEDGGIRAEFDASLTDDDRPCVSITFRAGPKHIYDKVSRSGDGV